MHRDHTQRVLAKMRSARNELEEASNMSVHATSRAAHPQIELKEGAPCPSPRSLDGHVIKARRFPLLPFDDFRISGKR